VAAPKGNKFWLARSSHGRDPIFKTPDALWSAAVEYFEWVEDNPLYEAKAFNDKGNIVIAHMEKMRAMTIDGLTNFLDIGDQTWRDYNNREDFSLVCAQIAKIIRQQKFEGASADLLNPAIIARDLGLADRKEHAGDPSAPIHLRVSAQAERAELIEQATRLGVDPALLGLTGSAQEGDDA